MPTHRFGGVWTEKKLEAVEKYLTAYRVIFTKGKWASRYKTIYVDGFAGTGQRVSSRKHKTVPYNYRGGLFFDDVYTPPEEKVQRGSVSIALSLASPFDRYVFIEKSKGKAKKLQQLIDSEYAELTDRCRVKVGDANEKLQEWCKETDWSTRRAVVFLDPYGLTVEWKTIRALAATKAIDLWILFPLGTGVNRMLTRGERPPAAWSTKLTRILGSAEWKDIFYKDYEGVGLFYEEKWTRKVATLRSIGDYFLKRLHEEFAAVARPALPLFNSKGNPMYLLCFAAGSPTGANIAVRIAEDLIKKLSRTA